MYLLDTNVISELRRRVRADAKVAAWIGAVHAADQFLSAITILEIEVGAQLLARKDKAQGKMLRSWIDEQVLPTFQGRILAVDTAVAQRCARLHVPDSRAERDALIAATALVHRLTVVTRNVKDFRPMGVVVINPWE